MGIIRIFSQRVKEKTEAHFGKKRRLLVHIEWAQQGRSHNAAALQI
jgi:hypothetical protein